MWLSRGTMRKIPDSSRSRTTRSAKRVPRAAEPPDVRSGDTATKIAREQRCSYDELVKLNGIKDPKKIRTGQILKIPGKNG